MNNTAGVRIGAMVLVVMVLAMAACTNGVPIARAVENAAVARYGPGTVARCQPDRLDVGDVATCAARVDSVTIPLRATLSPTHQVDVVPTALVLETAQVAAQVSLYLEQYQRIEASVNCGSDRFHVVAVGSTIACSATALGQSHAVRITVENSHLDLRLTVVF